MRKAAINSGDNLNEWETKISLLERSNFDLKMQVYYLNEKAASNGIDSDILATTREESEEYHDYDYGRRTSDVLALTEENSTSKRRIIEL